MLDGTWVAISAEMAGAPLPQRMIATMRLVIDGSRYITAVGEARESGTLHFDQATQPKQLNLTGLDGPNRGKDIPCIFEETSSVLRICYDFSGAARPKEFRTEANTQLVLVTYKRE